MCKALEPFAKPQNREMVCAYMREVSSPFIDLAHCRVFKGKTILACKQSRRDTQGIRSPKETDPSGLPPDQVPQAVRKYCTIRISLIHIFHALEKEK